MASDKPPAVQLNATCTTELFQPLAFGAGVTVAVIEGGATTVKPTPLLIAPATWTATFPVVAPAGTGTTIPFEVQLVGVATAPLNVTVLVP